ncbi:MAG: HNH endonuclease [Patescibacteria group bacterium]|nr:HNH endonuclease [Patescibacteria group bacterium]
MTLPRFLERVDVRGENECWEWRGQGHIGGYGLCSWGGGKTSAHRVSWILHVGPISSSKIQVCHICDNRLCVNPAHLFLGTAQDNMRDMISKGRDVHYPKFSTEIIGEVHRLAASGMRQVDICDRLQISRPHVCNILKGNRRAAK